MAGDRVTRWLLACGVLGPGLFVVVFLVEGATRPAYDPMRTFVSQLSLDGGGWVQMGSFIVTGLLIGAFALGLRGLPAARMPRWGWLAVGLVAVGLVGAGLFVDDPWLGYPPGAPSGIDLPVSGHGWGHLLSAFVAFVGLVCAPLIFARASGGQAGRPWRIYSFASAILFPMLYVAALASADAILLPGGYAGLLQRAALVTALGWIALLAVRLFKGSTRVDDP